MQNYFNYNRRISSPVHIGSLIMGGDAPIRIQSMTNTSTMDTEKSVEQAIRIIDAGGELVRLTAQGVREAQNLLHIRAGLRDRGYLSTPLVADIHFNPKAADAAAKVVEKVRINPGNYVDSAKRFSHIEYTEEEYQQELARIREKFLPFLEICRKHKTAIRIGVNHGSLSDRIMSRYGDTPQGMVESCMEFLRICVEENFHDVVISMKASNTLVMVQSVRLLVSQMDAEGIRFPLHLGVTEAGDGEDGRIKSAVGIGALLADGLGDTIRVSLSEDPELEIPVARKLVDYYQTRENHSFIEAEYLPGYNWAMPEVRKTKQIHQIGGSAQPVVLSDRSDLVGDLRADYVFDSSKNIVCGQNGEEYPILSAETYQIQGLLNETLNFVQLEYKSLSSDLLQKLKDETNPLVLILFSEHQNPVGDIRAIFHKLMIAKCDLPVVLKLSYKDSDPEDFQLKSSADAGAFFLSGLGNGIWLDAPVISSETMISTSFAILQAARLRVSKTEYISCPSCGRTLFNLQKTIARIKEKTTHLKGLKIGIMGCIVNGPGEMADADYGYVGA
ncbi:MAG: (E)-4-hydroxy-3-methylbut-2-enyl-diphosphate synthase, partial [Bacteroidales bacterium]